MNINALKGIFVSAGYNTSEAAKLLGIPIATMYRKMKNGDFTIKEVNQMIIQFSIKNPEDIFFDRIERRLNEPKG